MPTTRENTMITRMMLTLLTAAMLLSGCALVTAANIYSEIEYRERAKEGKVPPVKLLRACNREGLVRDAEGRWQQGGPATTACFAKAGWEITPEGWTRTTTYQVIACQAPLAWAECVKRHGGR